MTWLTQNIEHPYLLLITTIIAIPVIWQYWKWIFGDINSFGEDLKVAALPDLFAALLGRYWESEWAELKIGFFIVLCVGVIAATYKLGTILLF